MLQVKTITIGTRSDLAMWQANHVKAQLEPIGQHVNIQVIKTKGIACSLSFDKIEGKVFH